MERIPVPFPHNAFDFNRRSLVGIAEPIAWPEAELPPSTRKSLDSFRNLILSSTWTESRQDPTAAKKLLAQLLIDSNSREEYERTVLCFCVGSGKDAAVKILLEEDWVDPNRVDGGGDTPLHLAVNRGTADTVKILLGDPRLDPTITDKDGRTPLQMAAREGKDDKVRILMDDDRADPNSTDDFGRTPLHWAVYCTKGSTVEILLHDSRVDVNRGDNEGHPPLFYALDNRGPMEKSRAPIIRMLLAAAAAAAAENVRFTGKEVCHRLLCRAIQQEDEEVVELLLHDGWVDPNSTDALGVTPLLWAKANGDSSIVNMLLSSSGEGELLQPHPGREIAGRCLDFWMRACGREHGGACCPEPAHKRLTPQIPAWVIDVSSGCIVPGQQVSRYVALSYVWSESVDCVSTKSNPPKREQLLLTRNSLRDFRTPGYFQGPIADRIPVVVHDAMALVNRAGEKYLWVDCLCIIQDDENARQQFDHMHEVYLGACLTIIAATRNGLFNQPKFPCYSWFGNDADFGWRNWGYKRCVEKLYYKLHTSKWSTRGWTFQEDIMSKRAVIFQDGDIFWSCQYAVWDQDYLFPDTRVDNILVLHNGTADRMLKCTWPDFRAYMEFVGLYNDRDLSFSQDALPAISGVLTALSHSFSQGFVSGLPRLFLDDALLWQPFRYASRRVAKEGSSTVVNGHLPSWSWCGWKCLVDPLSLRTGLAHHNDEQSRSRVASWSTSHLVKWSALSQDMQHEEQIHGPATLSTWAATNREPDSELPCGWSRCTDNQPDFENPDDGLFMHVSDPTARFRRPVPICEAEMPQ